MVSLKRPAIAAIAAAMFVTVAMTLWLRGGSSAHAGFRNIAELRAAYAKVTLGMPASRLPGLGFDRTRPEAQTLSYLGAMEFFMPKSSRDFDRLDPAILSCLAAADRCGAFVFRLGGDKAELMDFAAHAAATGGLRVIFLMKSGRVAYKGVVGGM